MFNGGSVKWRSSQIGVDDHSGRIDDSTEPGLYLKIDLLLKEWMEIFDGENNVFYLRRFFLTEEFFAESLEAPPDCFDHYASWIGF
jgi:hypothetical protein